MDRGAALDLAARIGASYPSARVTGATLDEWAAELQKLQPERGERLLDWLRSNVDHAPSFKQLRAGMAVISRAKAPEFRGWQADVAEPREICEFCQQPVANGPDAASRYDSEFDRWFHAHLSCADARSQTQREGMGR